MFFTRHHLPKLLSSNYEKEIKKLISSLDSSRCTNTLYPLKLELKKHALIMSNSICELQKISPSAELDLLEKKIKEAVLAYLQDNLNKNNIVELNNIFSKVKQDTKDNTVNKLISAGCFTSDAMICTVAVAGLLYGAAMIVSGPTTVALLGIGLAVMAAVVLSLYAYSAYVEGKFLFGKHISDIESGINALDLCFNYSKPKSVTNNFFVNIPPTNVAPINHHPTVDSNPM